jgi:predicted  nucleic acid-binding Zn-ribbon protein
MATHPQLASLLQVQDLERELVALKGQAEAISIPLEKTRARRQMLKRDVIQGQEKLEHIIKLRREKEREMADLEHKLSAAEARLSSARNSKEAQAHEAEIERARAGSGAAEDEALALLEREEHQTGHLEKIRARTDRDLVQINEEIARLEKLLEENQRLAKGLREERIAAVNALDPQVRGHYDWLLKRYGPAQAVVRVSGAACGGCGSMLLPDQALKVDDLSQLHQCTHCARYLAGR